ncbi:MAG: Brp/Blh family beta-carotene 15,15'-dioxygenase [Aquimonas sp.]|nr:Brp/Blh family beta-carotene 15,15'-dioxygenase [Aquimonas sp.]
MSRGSPETLLFLFAASVALAATGARVGITDGPALIALVAAVALIGLPHGGLDGWLAQRSGVVRDARGFALFHVLYVLAAGTVALLWLWLPTLTLMGFLLISAWHFAGDWPGLSPLLRTATGLALLSLPAWFWAEPVASIFSVLAGDGGLQLAQALTALGPLFALMLGLALLRLRRTPRAMIELGVLSLLALFTPPLLFFAVYFCTLHSPRQLRLSLALAEPARRPSLIALAALYAVLAALLVLAAGFATGQAGDSAQAWLAQLDADQGLRLVFIGLAALTVPHMGVAWLAARRSQEK